MTKPTEQTPGAVRRRVGDCVVTTLNDGGFLLPEQALVNAPADLAAAWHAAGRPGPVKTMFNAFLLQWDGRTVLVDTGCGGLMGAAGGNLPANLRAAGVAPDDIDAVLMTHMHSDHFGGLLDAAGLPAFPRAELVIPEAEMAFWEDDSARAAAPEDRRGAFDAVRQHAAAYGSRLRRFTGTAPLPGIEAVPLPGHTPGHTGYMISSGGDRLLIWGDIVHLPDLQFPNPAIGLAFDSDPALARATREAILARAAEERMLVAGMHMHFPAFATVSRAGSGYAYHPEPWRPTLD